MSLQSKNYLELSRELLIDSRVDVDKFLCKGDQTINLVFNGTPYMDKKVGDCGNRQISILALAYIALDFNIKEKAYWNDLIFNVLKIKNDREILKLFFKEALNNFNKLKDNCLDNAAEDYIDTIKNIYIEYFNNENSWLQNLQRDADYKFNYVWDEIHDELNCTGNGMEMTFKPFGREGFVNNDFPVWTYKRGYEHLNILEKCGLTVILFLNNLGLVNNDEFYFIYKNMILDNGRLPAYNVNLGVLETLHRPSREESIALGLKVILEDTTSSENAVNMIFKIRDREERKNRFLKRFVDDKMSKGASFFNSSKLVTSRMFKASRSKYDLKLGNLSGGMETIYVTGDKSLITIAPPGAGKTLCNVIPNLLTYEGSAIVLDIKGACYRETAQARADMGHNIYLFAPRNPEVSSTFNPLDGITRDTDNTIRDARRLAEIVVPINKGLKDQYWDNKARDILTGIITLLIVNEGNIKPTMTDILRHISLSEEQFKIHVIDAMLKSDIEELIGIGNTIFSMVRNSEKTFENVIDTLRTKMGIWWEVALQNITASTSWDIEQFRKTPTTIYIVINIEDISSYAQIAAMLISNFLKKFMSGGVDNKLLPVLLFLDELPQLGYMGEVPQAIEYGREFGIKTWSFIQNRSQLEAIYGKDIANSIINNCGVQVYMNVGLDLSDWVSRSIGEVKNQFTGENKRLIEAYDLSGQEYQNIQFVYGQGEGWAKVEKEYYQKKS